MMIAGKMSRFLHSVSDVAFDFEAYVFRSMISPLDSLDYVYPMNLVPILLLSFPFLVLREYLELTT